MKNKINLILSIFTILFLLTSIQSCDEAKKALLGNSKELKKKYALIKKGMKKEKVIKILGKPSSVVEDNTFGKTELLSWDTMNQITNKAASISVHISKGKVISKSWTEL